MGIIKDTVSLGAAAALSPIMIAFGAAAGYMAGGIAPIAAVAGITIALAGVALSDDKDEAAAGAFIIAGSLLGTAACLATTFGTASLLDHTFPTLARDMGMTALTHNSISDIESAFEATLAGGSIIGALAGAGASVFMIGDAAWDVIKPVCDVFKQSVRPAKSEMTPL